MEDRSFIEQDGKFNAMATELLGPYQVFVTGHGIPNASPFSAYCSSQFVGASWLYMHIH